MLYNLQFYTTWHILKEAVTHFGKTDRNNILTTNLISFF